MPSSSCCPLRFRVLSVRKTFVYLQQKSVRNAHHGSRSSSRLCTAEQVSFFLIFGVVCGEHTTRGSDRHWLLSKKKHLWHLIYVFIYCFSLASLWKCVLIYFLSRTAVGKRAERVVLVTNPPTLKVPCSSRSHLTSTVGDREIDECHDWAPTFGNMNQSKWFI